MFRLLSLLSLLVHFVFSAPVSIPKNGDPDLMEEKKQDTREPSTTCNHPPSTTRPQSQPTGTPPSTFTFNHKPPSQPTGTPPSTFTFNHKPPSQPIGTPPSTFTFNHKPPSQPTGTPPSTFTFNHKPPSQPTGTPPSTFTFNHKPPSQPTGTPPSTFTFNHKPPSQPTGTPPSTFTFNHKPPSQPTGTPPSTFTFNHKATSATNRHPAVNPPSRQQGRGPTVDNHPAYGHTTSSPKLTSKIVVATDPAPGGTPVLKWSDRVDPTGVCKVNGSFPDQDNCNMCMCTVGRHVGCTLKLCTTDTLPLSQEGSRLKRHLTRGGTPELRWSDRVDPTGVCKVNGSFPDQENCNTCVCSVGRPVACTLKLCTTVSLPLPGEGSRLKRHPSQGGTPELTWSDRVDPTGVCKVNGSFPDQENCNTCVCSVGRPVACTLMLCTTVSLPLPGEGSRLKRHPSQGGTPELTWSDRVDPTGVCKVNGSFPDQENCNMCMCSVGRPVACTFKLCTTVSLPLPGEGSRPKRHPSQGGTPVLKWSDRVDPAGVCKVNGSFPDQDNCNTCVCSVGRHVACTLKACITELLPLPGEGSRLKRYLSRGRGESEERHLLQLCKPGDRWRVDCNLCDCNQNGLPECTFRSCIKWERITDTTQLVQQIKDKLDENEKCVAREMWEVECNTCFCSEGGDLYCTRRHCLPRREERSADSSSVIPAGGRCKAGSRWKLDECNTCVCTHTGYASCTLNQCSNSRPKREQTGFSEYVNESGRCRKKGNFQLDCNNCSCREVGGHFFCTLIACPTSGNSKRTRRAVKNENGNSGLECKPGVSWRENCNSCFCSERGIAMCTDIPKCPSPPPAPAKEDVTSPKEGTASSIPPNEGTASSTPAQESTASTPVKEDTASSSAPAKEDTASSAPVNEGTASSPPAKESTLSSATAKEGTPSSPTAKEGTPSSATAKEGTSSPVPAKEGTASSAPVKEGTASSAPVKEENPLPPQSSEALSTSGTPSTQ